MNKPFLSILLLSVLLVAGVQLARNARILDVDQQLTRPVASPLPVATKEVVLLDNFSGNDGNTQVVLRNDVSAATSQILLRDSATPNESLLLFSGEAIFPDAITAYRSPTDRKFVISAHGGDTPDNYLVGYHLENGKKVADKSVRFLLPDPFPDYAYSIIKMMSDDTLMLRKEAIATYDEVPYTFWSFRIGNDDVSSELLDVH